MATVKEIIDKLKTMPQDLEIYSFLGYPLEPDDIIIRENYPLGDPANPKCKYETVVYIK